MIRAVLYPETYMDFFNISKYKIGMSFKISMKHSRKLVSRQLNTPGRKQMPYIN